MNTRNKILNILMERDDMSENDALELIAETRELMLNSDPCDADEIMADMLGLEPDYIFDILGF